MDRMQMSTADPRRAALDFIDAIWNRGSLLDAWPLTDPILRLCFAQTWLMPMRQKAIDDGYSPDEVVAALAGNNPVHPLWYDFSRSTVRNLRSWGDLADSDKFGFGMNDRPQGIDTEVLPLYPVSAMVDGVRVAPPGTPAHPFLMVYQDDRWRVLNLRSDITPEPGWPPKLQ